MQETDCATVLFVREHDDVVRFVRSQLRGDRVADRENLVREAVGLTWYTWQRAAKKGRPLSKGMLLSHAAFAVRHVRAGRGIPGRLTPPAYRAARPSRHKPTRRILEPTPIKDIASEPVGDAAALSVDLQDWLASLTGLFGIFARLVVSNGDAERAGRACGMTPGATAWAKNALRRHLREWVSKRR